MSELAKDILRNCSLPEDRREDNARLLKRFFSKGTKQLEPFVLNDGHLNLILQRPEISAMVVCWNEDLTSFKQSHSCEKVWSYVVQGSVQAQYGAEQVCSTINEGETLYFSESNSHELRGLPGTISVHVYVTEPMNISTHPVSCDCTVNKYLVLCNEMLSLTDAEKGASLGRIYDSIAMQREQGLSRCTKALRLYTNFRDLIELLHHQIDPLGPLENHTQHHIDKVTGLLGAVRLDEREFKRYVRFDEGKYTRNLVGYDVPADGVNGKYKAKFTVLILCWDKGQMSPIHDHAGSSCWVKVLQGSIREIRYDKQLNVIRDMTLGSQEVCYINDTQGIHSMGNPDPDAVTVSMHVYAPPYVLCKLFETNGKQRQGSMAVARIPSNPFSFHCSEMAPSGTAGVGGAPDEVLQLGPFYLEVANLLESENFDEVGALMDRLVLEEHEWAEFCHFDAYRYTRSLVSLDKNFSLMICCWNSSQGTPVHSHGPNIRSWVKVLSGKMSLRQFEGTATDPTLVASHAVGEGDLISHRLFEGLHMLCNGGATADDVAVTLHLYSPPFVNMGYVDVTGVDRVIPVIHSAHSVERCCSADPISTCDDFGSFALEEAKHDSPRAQASACSEKVITKRTRQSSSADVPLIENLLGFFEQDCDKSIFTNLKALSRFVGLFNLVNISQREYVTPVLDRMKINQSEWRSLVSLDESDPTEKRLISHGPTYSLWIRRWNSGFKSKKNCLASESWIKVLHGEVVISQYLEGEQVCGSTATVRSSVFVGNKLQSEFCNMSTKPCIGLVLERS
mmetsp:Transcript_22738/g.40293  ORF Transcript_22738/g.40293 Transcript_22738/m.40293 type:complete len:791 (+) Transcript_22738:324-2696(+)